VPNPPFKEPLRHGATYLLTPMYFDQLNSILSSFVEDDYSNNTIVVNVALENNQ
jgi:hypothetical protein